MLSIYTDYDATLASINSAGDAQEQLAKVKAYIQKEKKNGSSENILKAEVVLRILRRRISEIGDFFSAYVPTHRARSGALLYETNNRCGDTCAYIRCDLQRVSLSDDEVLCLPCAE